MAFIGENDVIGGAADCTCVGGYFGGAAEEAAGITKELREYESSLSAKSKEEMIRRLARAMQRAGISVNPEGDLDAVVAELVKQLPNPKHGKTFAAAAEAQQKVCRVIADVLNDEFSPGATKPSEKLVDTSLSAVEICRQVGEWAHSFSAGINTEFLAVHASVKNAVRQLDVLEEVMAEAMRKIRARIAKTGDAEQSRDLMQFEELYSRASAEHKRTMSVLKNVLQVQLPPAAQSLEIAMRDHSELSALMKKINLKPGTSQFSDTLASAISGLGTAASVAHRVHKALKAANMSIRDYLDSPGFEDLERKLDSRVESGKIPPAELAKFLMAVTDLRTAFGERRNPQFETALESFETPAIMGGHYEAAYGGAVEVTGAYGGADEDEGKSATMRQLEKSRSENEIIIKDFARRLARHYDEFLTSVKAIGPFLGKEIPLTDHTDALRNAIDTIRMDTSSSAERLELALIGRFADAEARKLKEVFMGRMRLISTACEELMALEIYRGASSHFARILAAVTGIEKTVDYYSTVFSKKVGLNAMETSSMGQQYDVTSILPEIASSSLSLQEAVSEFVYLYYVARVRSNLTLTGAELDSYGKDYSDLLGDAIASKIRKMEKRQHELTNYLEGDGFDKAQATQTVATGDFPWPVTVFPQNATGSAARKEAAKMIKDEYKVKIEFYRAIQAIDLYLKSFTKGVALDAGALSDIKKLLDGAQVISRWFNQTTGDSIWQAFEESPSYDDTTGARTDDTLNSQGTGIAKTTHYYQAMLGSMQPGGAGGAKIPQANRLGIPEFGRNIEGASATSKISKAKKAVTAAYDNFQALKNLINAFARIGDVFSGRELRSEVFMSPSQIYKALVDYLKQSAMSINAVQKATSATPLQSSATDTLLGPEIPAVAAVEPWQVYFGSAGGGTKGNYVDEDAFFKSTIKAIAAKILTVLGVYDMFERTGPIYQLTPVRIIVGGADGAAMPIEGAAELYYRLPRLAEFYYDMFNWESAAKDSTSSPVIHKIALLADFEGTFAGLIRFIFLRTLAQKTGDYSDSEVQVLVSEINAIYTHYKDINPEGVVGQVINEFIKEINKRFGIIKKADYDEFMLTMRKTMSGNAPFEIDNTNYAILPGEGDVETKRRAPSDRFYERSWVKGEEKDPFKDRPEIGAYKSALEEFRDNLFKKLDMGRSMPSFVENSNTEMIKHAQRKLAKADERTKMHIAASLIRSDHIATESSKSFIFHETVVVGLNTLAAIETVLRRFSLRLTAMDTRAIESGIMNAVYAFTRGGQLGITTGGHGGAAGATFYPVAGAGLIAGSAVQTVANHPLAGLLSILNRPELYDSSSNPMGVSDFGTYVAEFLLDAENSPFESTAAAATDYRGRSGLTHQDANGRTTSTSAWTYAENAFPAAAGAGDFGTDFHPGDAKYADVMTGDELKRVCGGSQSPSGAFPGAAAAATWAAGAALIRKMRLFARLITNYQKIMSVFLEELFAITSSSGGLIDLSISQDGIRLGYGKLQEVVERILSDVKSQFDTMRPHLPKAMIDRYDGRQASGQSIPVGSIHWIETNLMDVFFRNQDVFMDPANVNRTRTLEGLSQKARYVFDGLVRKHNTSFDGIGHTELIGALAGLDALTPEVLPTNDAAQRARYEWYGSTLAGLVYYDATQIDSGLDSEGVFANTNFSPVPIAETFSGLIASQRAIDSGPVNIIAPARVNPLPKGFSLSAPGAVGAAVGVWRDTKYPPIAGGTRSADVSRIPIYDPTAPTTVADTRSVMFSYNQLVARFIETFTDSAAGRRIYLNLINSFANGTASGSVFDPSNSSHPDLMGENTAVVGANPFTQDRTFGYRGDPMAGCVLVESLGYVLQRLMRDNNSSTQVSDHLLATLTDVPLYMKEVMRANLPSFIHLFELLVQKCDFFKQIIQKTAINLNRQHIAYAVGINIAAATTIRNGTQGRQAAAAASAAQFCPGGVTGVAKCLYPLDTGNGTVAATGGVTTDSATMKMRITTVLDGVSSGSLALIASSSETLQELADDPIYFQTGENAIEQYTTRNGKAPLMPISMLLFFLRDNTTEDAAGPAPGRNTGNSVIANQANTLPYINYKVGIYKNHGRVGKANEPASILYPGHSMGLPNFRMLYGVRGLLASKGRIDYEHLPGVRGVLDTYNSSVTGSAQLQAEQYLSTMRALVSALQWVVDAKCFKGLISPYVGPDRIRVIRGQLVDGGVVVQRVTPSVRIVGAGVLGDIIQPTLEVRAAAALSNGAVAHPYWYTVDNGIIDDLREQPAVNIAEDTRDLSKLIDSTVSSDTFSANSVYGIRIVTTPDRLLQVTESSDQSNEIDAISKSIGVTKKRPSQFKGTVRQAEQLNSIIEMNVIPINVHALMRGIPLANVLNYEASFDQYVEQMLGEKYSATPRNARQMMLKLLKDPYCTIDDAREYGSDVTDNGSAGFVHRIFRGDNGIGMGRPKFLSDQLFNKALFGSVYQSRHDYDEGGPLVGIGASRGRNTTGTSVIRDIINLTDFTYKTLRGIGGDTDPAAANAADGPLQNIIAGYNAYEQERDGVAGPILAVAANTQAGFDWAATNWPAVVGIIDAGAPNRTLNQVVAIITGAAVPLTAELGHTTYTRLLALATGIDNAQGGAGALVDDAPRRQQMRTAIDAVRRVAPGSAEMFRMTMFLNGDINGPLAPRAGNNGGSAGDLTNAAAMTHTTNGRGRQMVGALCAELVFRRMYLGDGTSTKRGIFAISENWIQTYQRFNDMIFRLNWHPPGAAPLAQWKAKTKRDRLLRALSEPARETGYGQVVDNNAGVLAGVIAAENAVLVAIDGAMAPGAAPAPMAPTLTKSSAIELYQANMIAGGGGAASSSQDIAQLLLPFSRLATLKTTAADILDVKRLTETAIAANPRMGYGLGLVPGVAAQAGGLDTTLNFFGQVLVNIVTALIADSKTLSRLINMTTRSQGTILIPASEQFGGRKGTLTWLDAEDDSATNSGSEPWQSIKRVELPGGLDAKKRLEAIGRMRFDTRFVRNMFFITNVMRIVRMKLARELSHSRSVLRSSHMAVAASITEYGADPFSPNEVYASKDKMMISRYDDQGTDL